MGNCAQVANDDAAVAKTLGCTSIFDVNRCNDLYTNGGYCGMLWDALLKCLGSDSNHFMCDSSGKLQPKTDVCTSEQSAYRACG